jgi:hypothetical protein
MTTFSNNPSFGFKAVNDQKTILVTQTLFNQPLASIRLYPDDAELLAIQLCLLLDELEVQSSTSVRSDTSDTPRRSIAFMDKHCRPASKPKP